MTTLCIYDKDFKHTKLQKKLSKACACYIARRWVQQRNQENAWKECPAGSWLHWIVNLLVGHGAIHWKYLTIADKALRDKSTNMSPADRVRTAIPYYVVAKGMTKLYRKGDKS